MRRWQIGALVLLLATVTVAAAQDDEADVIQAPPLFALLKNDREYPIARVCFTEEGICMLPLYHPPGQPCACRRGDGLWVSGVCTH